MELPAGEGDASAAAGLEPYGGNMNNPHYWMVNRGRFWRCGHGNTGYDIVDGVIEYVGCPDCPEATR